MDLKEPARSLYCDKPILIKFIHCSFVIKTEWDDPKCGCHFDGARVFIDDVVILRMICGLGVIKMEKIITINVFVLSYNKKIKQLRRVLLLFGKQASHLFGKSTFIQWDMWENSWFI